MNTRISLSRRTFLVGAVAIAATPTISFAAKTNVSSGLAVSGYDVVAYFTQNAAVKGSADFTAEFEGATYNFASAENRDAFAANPAKYAPKYGGFCAYAVSKGYTAPIDPEAFSIVEGSLYLNYSKGVRSRWAKDTAGNIKLGDQNWPELSKK